MRGGAPSVKVLRARGPLDVRDAAASAANARYVDCRKTPG